MGGKATQTKWKSALKRKMWIAFVMPPNKQNTTKNISIK